MTLTLCTYTFNDPELVHGLLENEAGWSVRPDEIVVTDDGSDPPFVPLDVDPRLRLLRLEPNQGFAGAKSAGIGAAAGEVILSADCDIRLDPRWLELALPHALDPRVGLVAGRVEGYLGTDTVSRYLSAFDRCEALERTGFTDFAPGMVFLLRREVWRAVGGFGPHHGRIGEDHALCAALRRAGLGIYVESAAVARQARRLSRAAMCRRSAVWCGGALQDQMPRDGRMIPYLFEVAAKPLMDRVNTAIDLKEPLFIYLDLLHLAALVCPLLEGAASEVPGQDVSAFLAAFLRLFTPHPGLRALFLEDLAAVLKDAPPRLAQVRAPEAWDDFFPFAAMLEQSGFFAWMDAQGADLLRADDRSTVYSRSFYGEPPSGRGA